MNVIISDANNYRHIQFTINESLFMKLAYAQKKRPLSTVKKLVSDKSRGYYRVKWKQRKLHVIKKIQIQTCNNGTHQVKDLKCVENHTLKV